MNREAIQTNWHQLKTAFQNKWSKLTTDDLDKAQGTFEVLVGALQKQYGMPKDAAEKQIDTLIAGIDPAKLSSVKGKDDAVAAAAAPAVAGAPVVTPAAVTAPSNGASRSTTA